MEKLRWHKEEPPKDGTGIFACLDIDDDLVYVVMYYYEDYKKWYDDFSDEIVIEEDSPYWKTLKWIPFSELIGIIDMTKNTEIGIRTTLREFLAYCKHPEDTDFNLDMEIRFIGVDGREYDPWVVREDNEEDIPQTLSLILDKNVIITTEGKEEDEKISP